MHVTLVSGEFPPMEGGVGDYTRELAREFARGGAAVQVIAPGGNASDGGRYGRSDANLQAWRSLPEVDRLTRDQQIVHIQYQAAAYGMTPPIHLLPRYLRWRNRQRRVLVTFHDLRVPYLFPKAGALRRRALRWLAHDCDAVIATNQEDWLSLRSWSAARSLHLIPIGSNIAPAAGADQRSRARAALGVADGDCLLCYFGFLNASKGGEMLVRALATLRANGRSARLLMLGGEVGASDPTNHAYAQQVKALVAQLGLGEHVLWAGYRAAAEVSEFWRASDIAVLPYADGVSLRRGTLMAALAHGMPIISTTPRVPIAQLRDGQNIALVPPGDAEALAARAAALCDDAPLRQQLADGALALAQEFGWERIAERHLALYGELVAGR